MKPVKNVKLIRGSGFKHLDGSLVMIVETGDDGYVSVVPQGETKSVPIKIDARCIQEVNIPRVVGYEFTIEKYEPNGDGYVEFKRYKIDDALRDVNLQTIVDFLDNNLKPLLRIE